MIARRPWPDLEKILGIALLLAAILGVFLLRFPAHPMLGYSHHVDLRPHRNHILPSCAIVDDVFQPAALVVFGTFLCVAHMEYSAQSTVPIEAPGIPVVAGD